MGVFQRIVDILKLIIFLSAVLLAIMFLGNYSGADLSGRAQVLDGDSLRVGGDEVRLFGIDAPEFKQTCTGKNAKPYDCGRQARAHLAKLVRQKSIICSGYERDKYDRLLGTCINGEIDINEEMVRSGWAVSFGSYYSAENEARRAERGVWQGDFQTPSDWRKDDREVHQRGFISSIFGW